MAPVRTKTRSEVGLKESITLKPRHPPVPVSKRKADGSPLKPATTTQVKRHLVDNAAKENNVLMKTKAQLINLAAAAKKPLGLRNLNTHSALNLTTKDGKIVQNVIKKDALSKADSKENIVTRMSLAKISDNTKSTGLTLKPKVSKVQETKPSVVKPLAFKDLNRGLIKPIESKVKPKTDVKLITDNKEKVILGKTVVENRRASSIPVNVNKLQPKKPEVAVRTTGPVTRQSLSRKSSDNESTLYESAIEDFLNDTSGAKKSAKPPSLRHIKAHKKRPPGVEDFDLASTDLFSVGKYAFEIFEYLKSRENLFKVSNYMPKQKGISKSMRAVLVDWMAEIQENFELNHETLYLAVKIIDLYLSKVVIHKDQLQLLAATAMLISCKYDERTAPSIDDFIDASDHGFSLKDVMSMECKILRTINYDLGCPLSYRLLRRYARCAKFEMPLLTLARYILELSLMEYTMALESESKLAAAALYLAIRMKKESIWTPTLEYYSGYKVEDFKDIVINLNVMLHQKPRESTSTIRKKYSHDVFFRVTEIPLLDEVDFPLPSS